MSVSCRKAGLPPAGICGAIRHPPAGPRPRLRQSTRHRAAQRHQGVSHTLCVCLCERARERETGSYRFKMKKSQRDWFCQGSGFIAGKMTFLCLSLPPPHKKKIPQGFMVYFGDPNGQEWEQQSRLHKKNGREHQTDKRWPVSRWSEDKRGERLF